MLINLAAIHLYLPPLPTPQRPPETAVTVSEEKKSHKRRLVQETAENLRELILAREPGAQIGSLTDVAQQLGVGIVTVQQAARVLEHEGLLNVRRGPRGGYYGARPDEAALERAFAAYLRVHDIGQRDAAEMMALIDCEIVSAAARCTDEKMRDELRALERRIERCTNGEERIEFEEALRNVLFRIVSRPLIELMSRVTTQLYRAHPRPPMFVGEEGIKAWENGRRRILQAILAQDEELARFEAERYRKIYLAARFRSEGNLSS